MKSVIVLGGYGAFGTRLSRRLSADGWSVLVAGRNQSKAAELASQLPYARPLVADRDRDLSPVLLQHRPFLLIDAAGPFQGSSYQVAEACIANGVHYIDLADGRGFVSGMTSLDAAARRAGITVVTGASSVPALSGAVVERLAADMDDVRVVNLSISASNKATAGASIAAAILSYVGKPVRLWRGRRWVQEIGWRMLRWETYRVAGQSPIRRLVALSDVPDHDIVPETIPGRPAAVFRAGPEFASQLLLVWLLGWLVQWRWLRSLKSFSKWLVTDALIMAIWRRGKSDALLHHSDQGSQGRFNRSPQHPKPGGVNGYGKTEIRAVNAPEIILARAATGMAA